MKEVKREEFYGSKYVNDPAHDCEISVDYSSGWPYTSYLKLKRSGREVGKVDGQKKYFLINE